MFKLGLIINPLAGVGGSVALKGSDGVAEAALALGATPRAQERTRLALEWLQPLPSGLVIHTGDGEMGGDLARDMGFETVICHHPATPSSAEDTRVLAERLAGRVDLILFAGGDGTARDLCAVLGERPQPVLGVPAGVKIHSGVYAISPVAAGRVAAKMIRGELLSVTDAEVRDIDETAFRAGQVRARYFGQMMVPEDLRYLQAVKMGGREETSLVLADIAAETVERMQEAVEATPECQFIMGSGSTVAAIMAELGLENTLLGVDLVRFEQGLPFLAGQDLTATQLLNACRERPTKLVITLIGGQGHLLGRGNQQLSPAVIEQIGRENFWIVATKSKLRALEGRPMLADSGAPDLDRRLTGHYRITTGYRDAVLYPLAEPDDEPVV
ncbi:ATP-NAD kinase family protein [Ferrimonas gelatinilytica]|uniref:ATP-NAD kinase family protein n=1 Tax=Ferrimonas gelatinilytica TaxID=1255257 RepID=A0ABP9S4Z1_9GAMM